MPDLGSIGSRYCDFTQVGESGQHTFRAVHAILGQPVLVRSIPRLSNGLSAQAELFRRGARAAARLDHPSIIRVYEYDLTPFADVLVQEFVEGPTLDEYLRLEKRLSMEQAFAIAGELADALAFAHQSKLIHRNLSPGSIQLTRTGAIKLGGFEAAASSADDSADDPFQAQRQLGNPLYMSPEQAKDGTLSPRSDIYSLGALLYHLLTGQPPFTGTNTAAILFRKQTADPTPPAKIRSDLPPAASEFIMRLLARNPGDRPAEMAAAREGIRRFASPQPPQDPERRGEILLRYPSPIALAYSRMWRDQDGGARFDRLMELVENTVKYCAVGAVLSACDARGESVPVMLDKLNRPAFGKWFDYLRQAVELRSGVSPFVDAVREALFSDRRGSGTILDLAVGLLEDRNDVAHGRASKPEANDHKPFRQRLPVVHELLMALECLTEFPLIRIEEVDVTDDEDEENDRYDIRYRLCAGLAPSTSEDYRVVLERKVKKHRVGLLFPKQREFLNLAPFVHYDECPACHEQDVFMYNAMDKDNKSLILLSAHGPPHLILRNSLEDLFVKRGLHWRQ